MLFLKLQYIDTGETGHYTIFRKLIHQTRSKKNLSLRKDQRRHIERKKYI